MTQKADTENVEEELREAFRVFDRSGKGFITRSELGLVMANMGEQLTPQEIEAMISEADKDGDGVINYEEFYALMN